MYSNSRNDVPRVAQRYGTIAAHTRRCASVLVVFVVFCRFDKADATRRSVTLQSPTASLIPLFSSSELTGCGYPGLLDRKNRSDMCPRWESNPRLPACKASTLSTRPGSPLKITSAVVVVFPFYYRRSPPILSGRIYSRDTGRPVRPSKPMSGTLTIFILIVDSHESEKQAVLIHVLFFFVCTKMLWAINSVPSEEFDQTAQMCGLI